MKNIIFYIVLISFFTNCSTLAGVGVDSLIHKNKLEKADKIQQENQLIVMETIGGKNIIANYKEFVYRVNSSKNAEQSSPVSEMNKDKINFPDIGD